ncbi:MAG TPA: beta-galactosidase GalA [Phnomibacter sp.]|nr:beta-galactosidase GalA [Phnomibacter sp.]
MVRNISAYRWRLFTALFCWLLLANSNVVAQVPAKGSPRQRINFDKGWRFALGHPSDVSKDFQHGTSYFSYLAKAAYGDGAAASGFDDRAWRQLDLPHDWAVEQPFSSKGSLSHGFKAVGRNFPDASVGWYRKKFTIAKAEEGKRISIVFDGLYRNASVWVNGFYLGTEPSGYTGFEYNISEYLNYGGENTIAVRADATMEEGWFYEGAGIYRHVWLSINNPLHISTHGVFVTSHVLNDEAKLNVELSCINEKTHNSEVQVQQTVLDANGKIVAQSQKRTQQLPSMQTQTASDALIVKNPVLWSLENPYLYSVRTAVYSKDSLVDLVETPFGIRTIRFDANTGFYLNGKHVKITGTNNHQDHAGVGAAIPDALQVWRLKQLKAFGSNAYRCSHNPPTPELLDACDRLGILVIDENRLMGVSSVHFEYMKRFMLRDRNHPSIISWSIGNEEWGIEGNELGAKIATTLQAYTKSIDTTRIITAAISGGWQKGISNVIDMMGVNYVGQINTDQHHAEFPNQPMWGTEEGTTRAARGVYKTNNQTQLIAAYDARPYPNFLTIEEGWKYYASRDYLAGLFLWTGFDYRGEPTPYGWPSVTSYFGMLDLCGFPKDNVWYLKSWWTKDTVLHILPHWNWPGEEDSIKDVRVFSNCDEVELFLNKKSLGRKSMQLNGHLAWAVKYAPGTLQAVGYKGGKKVKTETVVTTGVSKSINLSADRTIIHADAADVAVLTIDTKDEKGNHVPVADDQLSFEISGPGKFIGVGNGSPVSLEPEKFVETIQNIAISLSKEKIVQQLEGNETMTAAGYDDAAWDKAFKDDRTAAFGKTAPAILYRGKFDMPSFAKNDTITFFTKMIGVQQVVYINGVKVSPVLNGDAAIRIDAKLLQPHANIIAIVAKPLLKKQPWDVISTDPGVLQVFSPAATWQRKLFNGYAQLLVQSTGEEGNIEIKVTGGQLKTATIQLQAKKNEP